METREMTVHEGLSKIKTADSRITKLINSKFVDLAKSSADKIDGIPIEDYKKTLKSSLDKITDIINETNAIKAAISRSNASTMIVVSGKEMTVAEAIYMWRHGITLKRSLLETLRMQYASVTSTINNYNGANLDKRVDQYIASLYGTKEKTNSEEVDKHRKDFIKENTFVIVDPNKLADRIQKLEDEISEFEAEVDAKIQMSNATTVIKFTV